MKIAVMVMVMTMIIIMTKMIIMMMMMAMIDAKAGGGWQGRTHKAGLTARQLPDVVHTHLIIMMNRMMMMLVIARQYHNYHYVDLFLRYLKIVQNVPDCRAEIMLLMIIMFTMIIIIIMFTMIIMIIMLIMAMMISWIK